MFLHRLHLNPRCRDARRDLADPYQLHSTLCRAFSEPEHPCPENAFLWRLEPERDPVGHPRILVQSRNQPCWDRIGTEDWFARNPDPALDLIRRLGLDALKTGTAFRFRLRANPCVTRQGKRLGLMRLEDQVAWIRKKGIEQHGFELWSNPGFDLGDAENRCLDLRVSQDQMLRGCPRSGREIRVFSVLFEGRLTVADPDRFREALLRGIGHGKALGLGLLSVVPIT